MDSAFTILQLQEISNVAYVEGLIGNFYLQSPNDLTRDKRAFDAHQGTARQPMMRRA